MLAINYFFDFIQFPNANAFPTHAIPNHEATSSVLHNLTNHTIAHGFAMPFPTSLLTVKPHNVEFTVI